MVQAIGQEVLGEAHRALEYFGLTQLRFNVLEELGVLHNGDCGALKARFVEVEAGAFFVGTAGDVCTECSWWDFTDVELEGLALSSFADAHARLTKALSNYATYSDVVRAWEELDSFRDVAGAEEVVKRARTDLLEVLQGRLATAREDAVLEKALRLAVPVLPVLRSVDLGALAEGVALGRQALAASLKEQSEELVVFRGNSWSAAMRAETGLTLLLKQVPGAHAAVLSASERLVLESGAAGISRDRAVVDAGLNDQELETLATLLNDGVRAGEALASARALCE
jgi:hypothetical protein